MKFFKKSQIEHVCLGIFERDEKADERKNYISGIPTNNIKIYCFIGKVGDEFIYSDDRLWNCFAVDEHKGDFVIIRDEKPTEIKRELIQNLIEMGDRCKKYGENKLNENNLDGYIGLKVDDSEIAPEFDELNEEIIKKWEQNYKDKVDDEVKDKLKRKKQKELEKQKEIKEKKKRAKLKQKGILKYRDGKIKVTNNKIFEFSLKYNQKNNFIIEFDKKQKIVDDQLYFGEISDYGGHYIENLYQSDFISKIAEKKIPCKIKNKANKREIKLKTKGKRDVIHLNDVKCRQNLAYKIIRKYLYGEIDDIEDTIEQLKKLGVRRTKVVEMESFKLRDVGKKQETLEVPISITPVNKNLFKVKIAGETNKVEWNELKRAFMSGNRVYSMLYDWDTLYEWGFDKEKIYKYLKRIILSKAI